MLLTLWTNQGKSGYDNDDNNISEKVMNMNETELIEDLINKNQWLLELPDEMMQDIILDAIKEGASGCWW